ncbi:phytoene/squalene synthase family protein [Bacteroidota bacterium]
MELYRTTSISISKIIAESYSTSFSAGMRLLNVTEREAIYALYGFVRIADEIVDTFHEFDKKLLLDEFIQDTYKAIARGVSSNPVLHSFQWAVNEFKIGKELIGSFFESMEMDLTNHKYRDSEFKQYVYGSASVVGLMCLAVFYPDNKDYYEQLVPSAKRLGEAFQKVNFLRDIRSDKEDRGRIYFPGLQIDSFNEDMKRQIEEDIGNDFNMALTGIRKLDNRIAFGVYLAYRYYFELYRKIIKKKPEQLLQERIRLNGLQRIYLLANSTVRYKLGIY